jgi:transcriptional regulator with XRE-family HTH domain
LFVYKLDRLGRDTRLILDAVHELEKVGGARIRSMTEEFDTASATDHIRRKRLSMKLLQKDVAEQIGVGNCLINNWEGDHSQPHLQIMPAVIEFLGYNPLPPATTCAERLVRHRTLLGLSQEESTRSIGVDPSTLARWERGEREQTGTMPERAARFFAGGADALDGLRRAV